MDWKEHLLNAEVQIAIDPKEPSLQLPPAAVSQPRNRVFCGNLLQHALTAQHLWDGDRSTVDALACYNLGDEAPDPCEVCKSTNGGGPFDKCIVLPNCFDNSCANSVFLGRPDHHDLPPTRQ